MGRVCETPSTGTPRTAAAIAAPSVALAAAANLRDQEDWRRQAKRAELADKLTQGPTPLAALNVEKAKADVAQKIAEADLGPVKHLATLIGQADEVVLRRFILAVALLLDPAAVLLLLAATRARS